MKPLTFLSIAALSSCSLAAFTMKIARSSGPATSISKRHLSSRATITESLANNVTGQSYMATVSVGSPGQTISLAIDTGSSDTWLLSTATDLCTDTELQDEEETGCQTPFNSKSSSSFAVKQAGAFHITYGDGTGVDGDYITDNLSIGGKTIKNLEMGFAVSANLTQGLLAVGYSENEASEGNNPPFLYPNIIDTMFSQGLISTKAYSLFLDDLEASTGSIIFGGLDTEKFHGNLVEIPIIPTTLQNGTNIFLDFGVPVTSLSLGNQSVTAGSTGFGSSSSSAFDAILDSGTSITLLPSRIAEEIFQIVGAVLDDESFESSGLALVDCNLISQNPGATFDFGFGASSSGSAGVTISVPLSEMVISQEKLGISITDPPQGITFSDICVLGLLNQDEEPFILGDTFLRSAYVVYDLQNNQIALAQTNFNATSSNVVDFTANESSIPNVSGVASGVSVSATVTGPVGGKQTGSSSTGTSGSGSASSSSASLTSVPPFEWSAIMVMCGSTALAILGGSLFYA